MRVFVKAEFRRPNQPLSKRLRRARAYAEGYGYGAFAAAGIPVPELLFFGEQPRWILRGGAVVATLKLHGQNAAETYKERPDQALVLEAARLLADIHANDLVHGDAVLRNFVRSGDRMHVIDVPGWGRFSRRGAERDLARLVGSVRKIGMDEDGALAILDTYVRAWPGCVRAHRVGFQGHVLREAAVYVEHLLERDRTREERHARLRERLKPGERRGARRL